MTRSSANRTRPTSEALDAADTPTGREIPAGYLDDVLPDHVKAAIKASHPASHRSLAIKEAKPKKADLTPTLVVESMETPRRSRRSRTKVMQGA